MTTPTTRREPHAEGRYHRWLTDHNDLYLQRNRVSQSVDSVETTYILDVATPLTMVLAETTGQDSIYYLHGLDLVAQSDGTTTDYLAYDGLGSVRQVLDDAGTPLLTQTFDPYGNLLARGGTGASSFGFTGEQVDTNGLVYLRARYYQPGMGRFFQMDPSRREMNHYRYAATNPVRLTDPSGRHFCESAFADPLECGYFDSNPYRTPSSWVSVPLVDGAGHPIFDEHRRPIYSSYDLGPQARRETVVFWAMRFARASWGEWEGTGFWTPNLDDELYPDDPRPLDRQNCRDCARFASWLLWRAGFRMDGTLKTSRDDYWYYEYNGGRGWWANFDISRSESSAWAQPNAFISYWVSHGAIEVPVSSIATLQKGDIIAYDYDGDGLNWEHLAMVIGFEKDSEGNIKPTIAGRGYFNDEAEDYRDKCDYNQNSLDHFYDELWGASQAGIKGLRMPYDGY